MLYEFITTYRDAIITRAREKLTARPWPSVSEHELVNGVPLFLTQLADTLHSESLGTPHKEEAVGATATRHGRDLLARGFTVSQVVHDYGDICQAVTEIALEQNAPITTDEFKTLNRLLDTATAEAVTEHARITAQSRTTQELERAGQVAHETRDLLNTAMLAYQALKRGTVAINGSTGAVLGRSLIGLRHLVDNSLAEVRIGADQQVQKRVAVTPFLSDIAIAGALQADSRQLKFIVELGDPVWAIMADPQVLASAVMNLLNNAFKFTPSGRTVILRASSNDDARLRIEVEDECGGIPHSDGDAFEAFGERRGADRTGLGLGLSMAWKAVQAQGGDISIRNLPGRGCVFIIDVPLAAEDAPPASARVES